MTEQLIEFTPGQKPAGIADDELIELRLAGTNLWYGPRHAVSFDWDYGFEYRFHNLARRATDDQLIAECQRRKMTVEKPLVTQAERDFVSDLLDAGKIFAADALRNGKYDQSVRDMVDYLESDK